MSLKLEKKTVDIAEQIEKTKMRIPTLNRMQLLEQEQIEKLHNSCIQVLKTVGVIFHEPEAVEIFKKHGFQVEGSTVFLNERQIMDALETAPSQFEIRARNPGKSVTIGGNRAVLSPGWEAPYVIDIHGNRRRSTMDDSSLLYKLVQTSPYLDMVASSMVVPGDIPAERATSEQLARCLSLTDLPLTTNPCSRKSARETVDMAAIVWGSREAVTESPVSIVSVNPLSPLSYGPEAAGGLIEFARAGQALLISSMVMAGLNGPVTLAGTAVIEMAESLSGTVLAQLVRPGVPCVFGGTSSSADLRHGSPIIGSPELIKLMGISTQMSRFYGLPCRYGGGLTDAHFPDMQAGIESALAIALSSISGVHFMHQACGILGTYMSMNLEKFVIDEEIGGYVKNVLQPVEISDVSLALDSIKSVGGGGNFLTDPLTAARCRTEFFMPRLAQRINYYEWEKKGKKDVVAMASEHVNERLKSYVKPDLDPSVVKDLFHYSQTEYGTDNASFPTRQTNKPERR